MNVLTQQQILSLGPGKSVADAGEARGLRVWNKEGRRKFLFRYRNRATGKLSTIFIGEFDPKGDGWTIKKARAKTRELRAQLDAGDDPRTAREAQRAAVVRAAADSYSIEQLKIDYLESVSQHLRPTTLADYTRELDLLVEEYGTQPARNWEQPDVLLWLDHRRQAGHRAAGHALSACRAAWNWAADRRKVSGNPWARLRKELREAFKSGVKEKCLDNAELKALVKGPLNLNERERVACLLILLTGCRPGEACAARWSAVDLTTGTWRLSMAETKGKAARPVYLSPAVVALLTEWKASLGRGRHRHLFPAPEGKVGHLTTAHFANAVADADVAWRPHDLRRTATTRLQALGARDEVTQRVIGHKQKQDAFGHYAHYKYEAEQREWLARLADDVQGVCK